MIVCIISFEYTKYISLLAISNPNEKAISGRRPEDKLNKIHATDSATLLAPSNINESNIIYMKSGGCTYGVCGVIPFGDLIFTNTEFRDITLKKEEIKDMYSNYKNSTYLEMITCFKPLFVNKDKKKR